MAEHILNLTFHIRNMSQAVLFSLIMELSNLVGTFLILIGDDRLVCFIMKMHRRPLSHFHDVDIM
jgi:hypothetical protein